jgi:RNA polymerase sigma-70 factor (ECF subfamily)
MRAEKRPALNFFHLQLARLRLTSVERAAVTIDQGPRPQPRRLPEALDSTDERWIAALRAGDPGALEKLARAEAPRVAGLLRSLLGPRADIEDLVQTVFLETCRALPGFRGDSAVSSFVGGITVRVARRAMRPSLWTRLRAESTSEPAARDNPEQAAQQSEQLRRVHAALERLTSKKRAAFLLWALEGMEVPAIAALMEASVPATKSRILYAQRELRQRAERDPYLCELLGGLKHERR